MNSDYEIIKIKEESHPQDHSRIYLCQIAVRGIPTVPFYSHSIQRQNLGEEGWLKSLCESAEDMLAQFGRSDSVLV